MDWVGARGHRAWAFVGEKVMSLPNNLMIPTSGDPQKDQEDLALVYLHNSRIEANICPNGCGPMVFDDPHNKHCEACGFAYFCSSPFPAGEA